MFIKRILIATVSFFLTAVFFVPSCSALQLVDGARHIPAQSNDGKFSGTWFYVDRDQRFALFFKEEEGTIKIKLRWQMNVGESFETDWDGKCKYMFRGNEGNVNLALSNPENKNILEGTWLWQYGLDSGGRTEKATFKIYRSEKGFKLAWIMPDWERVVKQGEKTRKMKIEQMHILRKASDRIILWEEIPFD